MGASRYLPEEEARVLEANRESVLMRLPLGLDCPS